jgi:hypothetical protein
MNTLPRPGNAGGIRLPSRTRRSKTRSVVILRSLAWLIALHLNVAGCAEDASLKRERKVATTTNREDDRLPASVPSPKAIRVEVVVPERPTAGTAVPIRLLVTNTSSAVVRLSQKGCPPDFDVVISREDGSPVWRRITPDISLCDAALEYSLWPRRSRELEKVSWEQRDSRGRPVKPGRYLVQGVFFGGIAGSGVRETKTPAASLVIER